MTPFGSFKSSLLPATVVFVAACSSSTMNEISADGGRQSAEQAGAFHNAGETFSHAGSSGFVAARAGNAGDTTSSSGAAQAGASAQAGSSTHFAGNGQAGSQAHLGGGGQAGSVAQLGGRPQAGGATHLGGSARAGSSTVTGGSAGTPASGGAASCGTRDCRSSKDNDCNGRADSGEAQCECPTAGELALCNTGLPGICAAGKRSCTFAADNSSSTWSACMAPSALPRNCSSNLDNNCDGTADNLEASCAECGKSTPRSCDTHPGYDGVGACRAGTQTLIVAPNNTQCSWSTCTGAVGPTSLEACGPTAPDTNCNGTRGDGPGCGITTINIYVSNVSVGCSCSSSTSFKNYYAGTTSPGSGWSVLASFKVFTGAQPAGTVAVVNQTSGQLKYVGLASSFSSTEVVGFVSTSQPGNYVPLKVSSLYTPCTSGEVQALVGTNSAGTASYYAVP